MRKVLPWLPVVSFLLVFHDKLFRNPRVVPGIGRQPVTGASFGFLIGG